MKRKGTLLSLGITVVLFLTFYSLFLISQERRVSIRGELVGERALHVVQLEEEYQRIETFIDQSASLASNQALQNVLALKTNCGAYAGVPYWRGPETKQTLTTCVADARGQLSHETVHLLPRFIGLYPDKTYAPEIPTLYSVLLQEHGDVLDVVGTPLGPLQLRITPTASGITYTQKLVAYPGFRVRKPNILRDLERAKSEADGVLDACSGYAGFVDECVNTYFTKRTHREIVSLQRGKVCTEKDQNDDRTVVFCTETPLGKLSFAVYFPLNIPLEFTSVTFQTKQQTPLNWLLKGQNLGVNPGEPVTVWLTLTTPEASTTRVELCSMSCTLLWDGKAQEGVVGAVRDHTLEIKYTFKPTQAGVYTIKSTVAGDEIVTPENKVFV